MTDLGTLPEAVWTSVLAYLEPRDMRTLLLVCRAIKAQVQRHLYHELTLTEWASSGARLARAIHSGVVSEETCECVEVLRLQFTSIDEIREALGLSLKIEPRMVNVRALYVEAHKTEDALDVLAALVQAYRFCTTVGVVARAASAAPLHVAQHTLPVVTSLRVPRLFRAETTLLARINELELDEICDDGSARGSVSDANAFGGVAPPLWPPGFVFGRLAVPYACYCELGAPVAAHLELTMGVGDAEVAVRDPACAVLKLVACHDLPQIVPQLHTPSLRVLILCNIAPLPTIQLFESSHLDALEFLSVAPATLPALQTLANGVFLPALRLLLVLVSRASFLSDTDFLRKRETRRMVEWLQMLAAQYPVDVRDFSGSLRQDIYFSDGLWCLAAQTRYRKYLPLVAPPPLKSPAA